MKQVSYAEAVQQIISAEKYAEEAKITMEQLTCKVEVLQQSQQQMGQDADEHACAAQELVQSKGTMHAQLKHCMCK